MFTRSLLDFARHWVKGNTSKRRRIGIVFGMLILVLVVGLPLFAGTRGYPLAIVDGNSMNPTLHNGDLIFYTAVKEPVNNGTIIVFIQSDTGVSLLDALLKPIIIHRVVGIGRQPGGNVYYNTKGDNNLNRDSFATDSNNVLGSPGLIVPYGGFPILFLKTPFGLVAAIGGLSLYFMSNMDSKIEEIGEKKRLIAIFARESLNGRISADQFERIKLTVEYFDQIPTELLKDPTILSIVDWLKDGGVETNWKEEETPCPRCQKPAFRIVSDKKFFLVCPICSDWRPDPVRGH